MMAWIVAFYPGAEPTRSLVTDVVAAVLAHKAEGAACITVAYVPAYLEADA